MLTVICGGNGAGKTSLLALSRLILDCEQRDSPAQTRQANANATIHASLRGAIPHVDLSYSKGKRSMSSSAACDLTHLDSGMEWYRLRQIVDEDTNWTDLLQQHASRELGREDVHQLSYLTGKDYAQCAVFEIDDYGEEHPFPYFQVVANGERYGLEEMGAGEGALFLAWWNLSRIRGPGYLLIDEPEAHITPRSQRALMDRVAEVCSSRKVCCVVTTHSTDVVAYVPRECVRLLVRTAEGILVFAAPDDEKLGMVLGMETRKALHAIVEDRCARALVNGLLRHLNPQGASRVQAIEAGGESELVAIVKNYPVIVSGPKLLGVLDGDQKGKYAGEELGAALDERKPFKPRGFRNPTEFLPGDEPPDAYLRSVVRSEPDKALEALGRGGENGKLILASIEGLDHHDWLEELSNRVRLPYEQTIERLVSRLCANDRTAPECAAFVDRVMMHVQVSPDQA